MLWRYISKMFPWKISRRSYGQSGQNRSGQSTRHQRRKSSLSTDQYQSPLKSRANSLSLGHGYAKKTGTSSAVDTDDFSAGSGSESKARSKAKSRKSKVPEEALLRDGYQRGVGSSCAPLNRSPSGNLVIASAPSTPALPSEASSQPAGASAATINESNLSTACAAASTVYETADDGDFISTDRRRRRRAKGYKANSATNSSESLVKPATSRDREPVSSNTDTAAQSKQPAPPVVEVKKALPPSAQSDARPQDTVVMQKQNSMRERNYRQPAIPSKDSTQLQPKTVTTPATTASTLNNNTDTLLRPTQDNAFVHPLHALNSTSPIVRLKPSHKRSQSAQLPSSSPWSIPQPSSFNRKRNHGSSLLSSDSTTPKDSTPAAPSGSEQTDGVGSKGKDYDLFGQSSIWYSPFQSGLDISIESDHEQGKHGSRPLSKPRIHIDSVGSQRRLNLGPMLPPSSFFASSPRTPRIMPFSQRHNSSSLGVEDWSVRTRSSSIAAPMTPLLESDCPDPMDYFSGSRSASSSRRGSVENNLTESLLSGRARMFDSSEDVTAHPRQSSQHSSVSSEGYSGSAAESTFLSPQYISPIVPNVSAVLSSSNSPVLGQAPLDLPPSTASPFSSVAGDPISTFVNPWESNYPYRSNHTMSETFLPFRHSPALNAVDSSISRDRQSSLLRLMNGDSGIVGSDHGDTLFGTPECDDESEAIRRGFLFPSLAHHSHVSLHSAELTSFSPFASVEMSLAAAANQPPPLMDDPKYDFVELPIQNQTLILENTHGSSRNEASEKRPRDRHRHGRNRSGHHKSASLSSFFPPMSSTPGVSDSTSTGIQTNTDGTIDPLNGLSHNVNGEGRSSSGQGHGYSRQSRHQGSVTSRESDGASSTSSRRRAGTVQDSHHHRGVSKHHNHQYDSGKSKRMPKKEQHAY
ncbi:hypothetical protein BGZ58_007751 [Dissophora ornata]|nr:hypothetical protein BGZ58_007751 [Dissophora ornata]